MFQNILGKKKPAAQPQTPGGRREESAKTFPWEGAPDHVVANFAQADLTNNLPRLFTVGGRIHAETLLAATGAVAGYAAQQAMFARFAGTGGPPLHVARVSDGRAFYFGDPLNEMLIPKPGSDDEATEKLWSIAAGGAVTAGLAMSSLPPVEPMFAHVASTIGGPREGRSSLEKYRFHASTTELLKHAWPLALKCFDSELSGKVVRPPMVVSQRWRPVISARTANTFIQNVKAVVPPADALTIVMETAIYASKLPAEALATT